MPLFFTRTVNAIFDLRDDGVDHVTPEGALLAGVGSAVSLAADEIGRGQPSAALVVSVEDRDGVPLLRSVVTIAVVPLLSVGSPLPGD